MRKGQDMVIAIIVAVAAAILVVTALAILGIYAIGKAINHIQRGDF